MRKALIEPIGNVLRRTRALKVPPSVDASPVSQRDWEAAVGSRIAARARPISLDRGVLLVRAANATWAQELSLLSDAIVEQLRARGIEVKSLRFRVGRVDPQERPPMRDEVRRSPPEAKLPAGLRTEIARVADEDLRTAIARAAAKNLGWQQQQERSKTSKRPKR
jgi:hypothetical protein